MVDSDTQSIRDVLSKHCIVNNELADRIWLELYAREEDSDDVSGDERKDLKRLKSSVIKFGGRLENLSASPFTRKNGEFVSDVISSLMNLCRRIDERMAEPSRAARNPTTQTGEMQFRMFRVLCDAGIRVPRFKIAAILADILIATGRSDKPPEKLRNSIDQQLRNLKM